MGLLSLILINILIQKGIHELEKRRRIKIMKGWYYGTLTSEQLEWLNKQPWFPYKRKKCTLHEKLE